MCAGNCTVWSVHQPASVVGWGLAVEGANVHLGVQQGREAETASGTRDSVHRGARPAVPWSGVKGLHYCRTVANVYLGSGGLAKEGAGKFGVCE